MCNLNFDQYMQTYLSPSVYSLLCTVGVRDYASCADVETSDVLVSGLLNWSALSSWLISSVSSFEGCVHRVQALGPVFHSIHQYYREMSETDFETKFGKYFEWTAEPLKAVKCFSIVQHEPSIAAHHALLVITSILEHALGDIVLLRTTQCPFLLRDLLTMTELKDILSCNVVELLQTLLGPPTSLNLRNVVWHGFPRPGELHERYVYVMLCVTVSIGKLLEDQQICDIPHRDMVEITVPTVFSDVALSRVNTVKKLFADSAFVAPSVCQLWFWSLELYASGQYGECVVIMLPQLELALRRVFVAANGCSERILTAENTVLYTTFDEILDKLLPDGSENRLMSVIGKALLTLLLDCFHYPHGPRLRDHISHGEVMLTDVSKDTALHLICICIACASKFSSPDFSQQNSELVRSICSKTDSYESLYHPIPLLQQQTRLIATSLSLWHSIPHPYVDDATVDYSKVTDKAKLIQTQTENASRAIENYVTVLSADDKVDKSCCYQLLMLENFTAEVEKMLRSSQLNMLYRYHCSTLFTQEEEIVRLLLRIGKLCVCISEQILDVAESRYSLWQAKMLRSRQRTNYKKFLTSTVSLSITIRLITVIILVTVKILDDLKCEALKQQKLVKLFKHMQKYCENVLSYTRTDVNKWDEALIATHDLSCRIEYLKLA